MVVLRLLLTDKDCHLVPEGRAFPPAVMSMTPAHFLRTQKEIESKNLPAVKSPPSSKCICTAHCLSCDLRCISCWHFELIFADLVFYFNRCGFWLPPSPSPFWVCMLVSMGSGEYFPLNFLQCDGASWRLHAGVVPACRVAMDTSLLCLRRSGSRPTIKAPVLKFIYWR